jgi:hypothetical protein
MYELGPIHTHRKTIVTPRQKNNVDKYASCNSHGKIVLEIHHQILGCVKMAIIILHTQNCQKLA